MTHISTSKLLRLLLLNNLTIYLPIDGQTQDRTCHSRSYLRSLQYNRYAYNNSGFTLQNKQPVVEGDISKHFYHPYMQVNLPFIQVAMRAPSMVFSLFIYLARRLRNKHKISKRLTEDKDV